VSPVPLAGKLGIIFAALLVSIGLVVGAFLLFVYGLSDPVAGPGPKYPPVVGVRADGDELLISTGKVCPKDTEFTIDFRRGIHTPGVLSEARIVKVVLSEPSSSIRVTNPLPTGVTWQEAGAFNITAQILGEKSWTTGSGDLELLTVETAAQPPNLYSFSTFGWLTADEVAARDGKDLLTICTPRDN
jgi:hypothetical protein